MILLDSNIPMYLVGAEHPNKDRARALIERAVIDDETIVTDAEVYQEVLHRYVAIRRLDAIDPALELINGIVETVFPIELVDVLRARTLLGTGNLAARDAIHVAIMLRHEIPTVMSFDRAFDGVPGIERLA